MRCRRCVASRAYHGSYRCRRRATFQAATRVTAVLLRREHGELARPAVAALGGVQLRQAHQRQPADALRVRGGQHERQHRARAATGHVHTVQTERLQDPRQPARQRRQRILRVTGQVRQRRPGEVGSDHPVALGGHRGGGRRQLPRRSGRVVQQQHRRAHARRAVVREPVVDLHEAAPHVHQPSPSRGSPSHGCVRRYASAAAPHSTSSLPTRAP